MFVKIASSIYKKKTIPDVFLIDFWCVNGLVDRLIDYLRIYNSNVMDGWARPYFLYFDSFLIIIDKGFRFLAHDRSKANIKSL